MGEHVTVGTTLAKVVQPDQLKASLKKAETQARDIQIGQPAAIDTHNGVVPGRVTRIDPAVQNGTVTVEVALADALPQGARPDLSIDGTIDLDRLTDVLYVGRPAQGNENSTISLFRILPDGHTVVRVWKARGIAAEARSRHEVIASIPQRGLCRHSAAALPHGSPHGAVCLRFSSERAAGCPSAEFCGSGVRCAAVAPLDDPHSHHPLDTYRLTHVPAANLANSPRLDALVRDGLLELSLQQAIALALENNLDLAIARYNIPIAEADILRTRAGGSTRGVNTGVVQNTPGGNGVGGFGAGAGSGAGSGAGGTSGGAGGAGTGASGLVQSTLGSGTVVNSYDPILTGNLGLQHSTDPLSNLSIYGVPTLRNNSFSGNIGYEQAFSTGTAVGFTYQGNRQTTNSPFSFLNPTLNSQFTFQVSQPLLAGFVRGRTCVSCGLHATTRRSPMRHFSCR